MQVSTIVNGTISLILSPENDLEKEIVKQLNGATATLVSDGNSILSKNIGGSLLLKMDSEKKDKT